ncbi:MAG: DegV family protein [Anaerolineales bacterium]|uniref:DegV family protein n=1 Tax=Candidatus Desulfolinea nitratireducens TaxID=2841698 RepID=A0A8J6NJ53_9CHLR|nr:DegV family protein [Candidatus Desulfolinea nitratireducens]MBL6961771.1 DegV family protein [Anaerolineales bacterium]
MNTFIVTDSTCDLHAETISRYGIEVIPLHINMGSETFFDGVNITKEEFYRRLPDYDPSPSTAAPGAELFIQRFQALADKGAEAILSIHISESLSATINSARLAAKEFTKIPVTVLDSTQLSLGMGFLVERAAQMAEAGKKAEEIVSKTREIMPRTYVFAALDTLEYLRRSGRMHIAVARFGELLRLKPLVFMNGGKPDAHRVRTRQKAMDRLFAWLNELGPFEQLAIVHAGVQERAEALREEARKYFPDREIIIQQITPVLGTNLGIGAVGFAGIAKER